MFKKLRPDASLQTLMAHGQSNNVDGSSRIFLDSSPSGIPVSLSTTSLKVHTALKSSLDETYIWASNYSSADVSVTMSYTGAYDASDTSLVVVSIKKQSGLVLMLPGTPIKDCSIHAKASSNSSINLSGFALRYYPRKDKDGRPASDGSYDGTSE